mgnify:CR=1 FL=1
MNFRPIILSILLATLLVATKSNAKENINPKRVDNLNLSTLCIDTKENTDFGCRNKKGFTVSVDGGGEWPIGGGGINRGMVCFLSICIKKSY